MGRIFTNTPMEGKPLALRGLAKGWRLLEEAWESLEIIGGHVEWRNGKNGLIPRIVIDALSNEADEEPLHVWQIKDIGGVTSIYMPANSFTVNGKDFTALQTGLTAIGVGSPDWYSVASFATTGLNAYIVMGLTFDTFGEVQSLTFASSDPSSTGEIITIPILGINAEGLYSIHHSAINHEFWRPDSSYAIASAHHSMQEIDTATYPNKRTLQLYGFVGATAPQYPVFDGTDLYTHQILIREYDPVSPLNNTYLRYMDSMDFADGIGQKLVADTEWLSDLGDVIGGYIDWRESWNSSVKHTGIDFSGSTSAKGTGLSGGNTDHDDSYWHEAGLIASPFTDTKNFVTSGHVRAGQFRLENTTYVNRWSDTNFQLEVSGAVEMICDGPSFWYPSSIENLDIGTATKRWNMLSMHASDFSNSIYAGGSFEIVAVSSGSISLGTVGGPVANISYNGVAGIDISNWTTKGGLTGATIQEISIEDAQPSDKILVRRA